MSDIISYTSADGRGEMYTDLNRIVLGEVMVNGHRWRVKSNLNTAVTFGGSRKKLSAFSASIRGNMRVFDSANSVNGDVSAEFNELLDNPYIGRKLGGLKAGGFRISELGDSLSITGTNDVEHYSRVDSPHLDSSGLKYSYEVNLVLFGENVHIVRPYYYNSDPGRGSPIIREFKGNNVFFVFDASQLPLPNTIYITNETNRSFGSLNTILMPLDGEYVVPKFSVIGNNNNIVITINKYNLEFGMIGFYETLAQLPTTSNPHFAFLYVYGNNNRVLIKMGEDGGTIKYDLDKGFHRNIYESSHLAMIKGSGNSVVFEYPKNNVAGIRKQMILKDHQTDGQWDSNIYNIPKAFVYV